MRAPPSGSVRRGCSSRRSSGLLGDRGGLTCLPTLARDHSQAHRPFGARRRSGERRWAALRPRERELELGSEADQHRLVGSEQLHAHRKPVDLAERQRDRRPPGGVGQAVQPVAANSTSKNASTLPRDADSVPGGGGSTLRVGHSTTSAVANSSAARRVWAVQLVDRRGVMHRPQLQPLPDHVPGHRIELVGLGRAAQLRTQPAERDGVVDGVDHRDRVADRLGVDLDRARRTACPRPSSTCAA